jgi:hypothetical protein
VHVTNELRKWLGAVVAYEFGDADLLADLIRVGVGVPPCLRGTVADIIAGVYPRNLKGGAKCNVPPRDRGDIAFGLILLQDVGKAVRSDMNSPVSNPRLKRGYEPSEIALATTGEVTKSVRDLAAEYGVTERTIRDIAKDMRERISALTEAGGATS